jgi:hypothetical protein
MHPIVVLGDEAHVDAGFSSFDIVLILKQDRCRVCAECTIGLEIILDAPDGTPRRRGSSGCLIQFVWR